MTLPILLFFLITSKLTSLSFGTGKHNTGPVNIKSKKIGITSGASAPEQLVQNIISRIKKHSKVSIEEVVLTKENVTFKLPKALN